MELPFEAVRYKVRKSTFSNVPSRDFDKTKSPGLVVQSIVSLVSWLMTNSLTVVAKVFSNTLIFLLQKCEELLQATHNFSAKNINVFAIF